MSLILTKEHIGKIIYGDPWGNFRSRGTGTASGLCAFKVLSVGRRYAQLQDAIGNYKTIHFFTCDGGRPKGPYSGNGGYTWYANEADHQEAVRIAELRNKVKLFFLDYTAFARQCSDADAERIHDILFKKS